MARHTTPRTLNDSLRLGRLTLPQWVAVVVGGLSLWLWGTLAVGIHDLNTHVLVATVPVVLTVAPIIALWRGGIERYPQQLLRYTVRRGLVYAQRGLVRAHTYAQGGIVYVAATLRQRQAGHRHRT